MAKTSVQACNIIKGSYFVRRCRIACFFKDNYYEIPKQLALQIMLPFVIYLASLFIL
jgi:hypothetical protein